MTKIKEDARVHRRAVVQSEEKPAAEAKTKATRSEDSDAKKASKSKGRS